MAEGICEGSDQSASFLHLPDDALLLVCSILGPRQSLALAGVSTGLNKTIIGADYLWRRWTEQLCEENESTEELLRSFQSSTLGLRPAHRESSWRDIYLWRVRMVSNWQKQQVIPREVVAHFSEDILFAVGILSGRYGICGGDNGVLYLVDLEHNEVIQHYECHSAGIHVLSVRWLETEVITRPAPVQTSLSRFETLPAAQSKSLWHGGPFLVVTGSIDCCTNVLVCYPDSTTWTAQRLEHRSPVVCLELSMKLILTGTKCGSVAVWSSPNGDLDKFSCIYSVELFDSDVLALSLDVGSGVISACGQATYGDESSSDRVVKICHFAYITEPESATCCHELRTVSAQFEPGPVAVEMKNGFLYLSTSRKLRKIDIHTGETSAQIRHAFRSPTVMSATRHHLIMCSGDRHDICVFSISRMTKVCTLEEGKFIVRIRADAEQVYALGFDGTLVRWNVASAGSEEWDDEETLARSSLLPTRHFPTGRSISEQTCFSAGT